VFELYFGCTALAISSGGDSTKVVCVCGGDQTLVGLVLVQVQIGLWVPKPGWRHSCQGCACLHVYASDEHMFENGMLYLLLANRMKLLQKKQITHHSCSQYATSSQQLELEVYSNPTMWLR